MKSALTIKSLFNNCFLAARVRGSKPQGKRSGRAACVVILLSMVLIGQNAWAVESVTNRTFNGLSPWSLTLTSGSGAIAYDGATTRSPDGSGSISLTQSGRNVAVNGTVIQSLALPIGATVNTASLYTNLVTNYEGTGDSVLVELRYTDLTWVTVLNTGELLNSGWTVRTASPALVLAKAVDQIRITMNAYSGANNSATVNLRIDEVTIDYAYTKTIAGQATAQAASATSISFSMPYGGDSNANNTYTVDYKLSAATAWTNFVTNAAHAASPYTNTITGLTAGEFYDVRMTYNDVNGVDGTSQQTVEQILLGPYNGTTAGYVLIKAKNNSIRVRMPFFNNANGTGSSFKVEYKLSSSGTWLTWVTGATANFSPYVTTVTGLQQGTKYDVRATYTDTDGTVGYGTGDPRAQTVSNISTSELLHNSNTTLSSKWTGSRGWGYTGSKYGEIVCDTCHTKSTTNIKRITTGIGTPDATNWVSSGTRTVTVSFQSTTAPNGFGDDTATHTTSTKVCEVCHSQNGYHNYNQATAQTHKNNLDCMSGCHSHSDGFSGDGPCTSCHNVAVNEVYNTRQVTGTGGDFVRLSRHVSGGNATEIVTDYDCIICHAEGDADAASTGKGYVDTARHRIGSTALTRNVKLRNVDSINQTYDWNKNAVTEAMRTNMDTFCLNCHDSNGAAAIAVSGLSSAPTLSLSPSSAKALKPFNDSDNLQNGWDSFTTRTRVIDVKTQFFAGTGGSGAGYNGNPSQHGVLGARYSTQNTNWTAAAWVNHTMRNGTVMNTGRETARLHCADCHLVEKNAHGATNAWHMLMSGTANDYDTDFLMGGNTTNTSIVCYKCHNSAVYSNTASAGSRFSHNADSNTWGEAYGGGKSAKLGPVCLNCHGGDNFGNIHGVSGTYSPGASFPPSGTTYTKYRFLPGAWMQYQPGTGGGDSDFNTAGAATCYFPSSSTFSNCAQHAGGTKDPGSANYARPVKY